MEKDKRTKNKLLIITLIVIILILLLLIAFLLKKGLNKEENKLIPTGNVDIFEINCDCSNENNNNQGGKDDNPDNPSDNNNNNNGSSNNTSGEFDAYDSNAVWQSTNKLRIFENPIYQMDTIIAPLSTNSYQFVIRNNTTYNVDYSLKFTETNDYKINMKYRLKKNGQYIVGTDDEWVTYEKLNLNYNNITANSNDTFILEWKWHESDNDTKIGSIEANYSLSITLSASQRV